VLGAQIQGAISFGISNALFSKITLKDGRVEQGNFDSYPVLRLAGDRSPHPALDGQTGGRWRGGHADGHGGAGGGRPCGERPASPAAGGC
jgi:hypothetical protein